MEPQGIKVKVKVFCHWICTPTRQKAIAKSIKTLILVAFFIAKYPINKCVLKHRVTKKR